MKDFPSISDDFYSLRDDRTNRCISDRQYQKARCLVTIDIDLLKSYSGQVMLAVVCNLLSRWCRYVTIIIPNTTPSLISSDRKELKDIILTQMTDADPFGFFKVTDQEDNKVDVQIHLGNDFKKIVSKYVIINASDWYATISNSSPIVLTHSNSKNCLGAIAAACLGVAQVFKYSICTPADMLLAEGVFDLYRLKRLQIGELENVPSTSNLQMGRILMVGAGSIGSAAAYCLNLIQAACEMMIVDGDKVKIENFNRSPIFGKSNCGLYKSEAVAKSLSGSTIKVNFFSGWWEEFLLKHGRGKNEFDIWLPLANEFGVRWGMQNNLPPLMVHASTTKDWGVNHGRHIPHKDDCLVDRFPEIVSNENFGCSTTQVISQNELVDAALPFLSLFGGLLIVAELTRLQLSDYPQVPNFAFIDLGSSLSMVQSWNKKARLDCLCRNQPHIMTETFNGRTKYAS
ncbi:MAG: ThiF family adenylyltransferase [Acidobacteriota bacterium]